MRAYLEDRMIALRDAYFQEKDRDKQLLLDARYNEMVKARDYWEEIIK